MNKTAKLCCLVLTLCIITPMGIGFMMPSSANQEIQYVAGNPADITKDIRNSTSDYYGDYYGDSNNSMWGVIQGLSNVTYLVTTSTPTSTPVVDSDSQTGNFHNDDQDTSMSTSDADFIEYAYSMTYSSLLAGALVLTITTTVDGQTTTEQEYGIYTAYWLKASGKLVIDGSTIVLSDHPNSTYAVSSTDAANTTYTIYSQSTSEYADISGGISLANGTTTYWRNGYSNEEVVFNAIMQPNCSFSIGSYVLERSASGIVSITYSPPMPPSTTEILGNYSNIAVKFNEDGVTIYGLTAADLNTNPMPRVVTSKNMSDWPVTIPFTAMNITSTATEDLLQLYCWSAAIKVGSYESTVNKSLDMSGFWPDMKGYTLRFTNGSTIGNDAQLTIAGYTLDLYPKQGTVVYDGVSYPITGLIITVVNDGQKFYAYLNSSDISSELDQAQWTKVDLNGHWGSIGLATAKMESRTADSFNWLAGSFNLSIEEYAGIGLLTCALTFILTAFIGRRSGEKVFWLLVTSGCVGAVYLVLFL